MSFAHRNCHLVFAYTARHCILQHFAQGDLWGTAIVWYTFTTVVRGNSVMLNNVL